MQLHDALLLTSVYETFSIVVVEAWLTGTPVIATSVGVASEMPSFLGKNIRQNNSKDLADTIHSFSQGMYQYSPSEIREYALQFTDEQVFISLKNQFDRYFEHHE